MEKKTHTFVNIRMFPSDNDIGEDFDKLCKGEYLLCSHKDNDNVVTREVVGVNEKGDEIVVGVYTEEECDATDPYPTPGFLKDDKETHHE